jgi:hypothetical protein
MQISGTLETPTQFNVLVGTQAVDTYPFLFHGPPEKRVFLVNMPGFDDSTRTDAEVLREMASWLTASFENKIRLSGMIYLHRINQPRMQGSAKRNIMMFKKLCGDDALKNVILVTTMWDVTEKEVGAAREKQLVERKEFWGYMASKGSRVYRHHKTHKSAMKLIGNFVRENTKVTLEIQEEMVNNHKLLDSTAAGYAVKAKLAEERVRFKKEIKDLVIELQEALKKKDIDATEAIEGLRSEHRQELAMLDYVGGWSNASKVFIGLHRDGLTGCPQVNLSRGGLRTLAEAFKNQGIHTFSLRY